MEFEFLVDCIITSKIYLEILWLSYKFIPPVYWFLVRKLSAIKVSPCKSTKHGPQRNHLTLTGTFNALCELHTHVVSGANTASGLRCVTWCQRCILRHEKDFGAANCDAKQCWHTLLRRKTSLYARLAPHWRQSALQNSAGTSSNVSSRMHAIRELIVLEYAYFVHSDRHLYQGSV